MQRTIEATNQFRRDLKREKKSNHKNLRELLDFVVEQLRSDGTLPEKHRDHSLNGTWNGFRECHLKPDLLLIYQLLDSPEPVLRLVRLGSHSELFW